MARASCDDGNVSELTKILYSESWWCACSAQTVGIRYLDNDQNYKGRYYHNHDVALAAMVHAYQAVRVVDLSVRRETHFARQHQLVRLLSHGHTVRV